MATAVITGASSGIGLELARLFAADGYDLLLIARREQVLREVGEELSGTHGVKVVPLVADLARPQACLQIAERVSGDGLEVSALVNCAGFGMRGPFAETPLEREREMIEVNVRALTDLTKLLLPAMLSRRAGRILNVASTAAFQPGPLMSVYYATKAYVLSFSLALSVELEKTGVTATVLCPGPTRTEFQAVAGMGGTALAARWVAMDAKKVARIGYRGMRRGDPLVTPGVVNRLAAFGTRFVPIRWAARIAKLSQEVRK